MSDLSTPTTPPATPNGSIRDLLAARYCGWRLQDMTLDPMPVEAVDITRAQADLSLVLGLDPSMSVERLRADLALAAEIEWEIERYGDPFLMGVRARVEAGDGMAGRAAVLGEAETEAQR